MLSASATTLLSTAKETKHQKYNRSEKGRERYARYNRSPKGVLNYTRYDIRRKKARIDLLERELRECIENQNRNLNAQRSLRLPEPLSD